MKKALLLMAIITCLTACKKESSTQPLTKDLAGTWDLTFIYGGFAPTQNVSGSGKLYEFKSDSTYVKYVDNKATASGRFSIKITEIRDTLQFGTVTFTNPAYTDAWTRTPNAFLIGSSAADGPSYEYHKIKN